MENMLSLLSLAYEKSGTCSYFQQIVSINIFCTNQQLNNTATLQSGIIKPHDTSVKTIGEIPLLKGFQRTNESTNPFAVWLRQLPLKADNALYLYNGKPKGNQQLHYAVLDMSTGSKDLQQCADALMRLKAEYHFSRKEFDKISFTSGNGTVYHFVKYTAENGLTSSHQNLLQYLETVFINCGSYTIEAMTKSIAITELQPGDMFVKAGSPGHVMMVADMAVNKTTGQKMYLLLQSYMPAQDIHIVVNTANENISPWYALNNNQNIVTPGFIFTKGQVRRWK